MIKPKAWNGKDLFGEWVVTRKLDGVRALMDEDGSVVSRAGKPLYNLSHLKFRDAEIFLGSWEKTVSAVRTLQRDNIPEECVYSLSPLDDRLYLETTTDPTKEYIELLLSERLSLGEEGLVLRKGDTWVKVKGIETFDVEILHVIPGKGKHEGRMGALLTEKGKVGTGFTDEDRKKFSRGCEGTIIEVECMGLTPQGKFRHPRFVRERFDKV